MSNMVYVDNDRDAFFLNEDGDWDYNYGEHEGVMAHLVCLELSRRDGDVYGSSPIKMLLVEPLFPQDFLR